MDVRLLKKLRKIAKERFHLIPVGVNINEVIIEENCGLGYMKYYDNISGRVGYGLKESIEEPMTLEVGVKDLARRRRIFILQQVRSLRSLYNKQRYDKKRKDAEFFLRKF